MTVGIMFRFPVNPVTRTEASQRISPVTKTCFQLTTPTGRRDGTKHGYVVLAIVPSQGSPRGPRRVCTPTYDASRDGRSVAHRPGGGELVNAGGQVAGVGVDADTAGAREAEGARVFF